MATKKTAAKAAAVPVPANDNITKLIGKVLPQYHDTDDYIDIVQWNLRWFNSKEPKRVDAIYKVLAQLNSDIFVFQEVADGSVDGLAERLTKAGLGTYEAYYGSTGGQQRVAFMYDTEWVRRKDEVAELFGRDAVTTPRGKDVFPRLPLWGYFYCRSTRSNMRGFDFQLVGLHLKSQLDRGGLGEDELQRTLACGSLMNWLEKDADALDSDALLVGDWNEGPEAKAWASARLLEKRKRVKFSSINDASDFSHLYYRNRNDVGSRLDLRLATSELASQLNKANTTDSAINWVTLDQLLGSTAQAKEVKALIKRIKDEVTDHLPVLTRFGR
jgi:exonuclease III